MGGVVEEGGGGEGEEVRECMWMVDYLSEVGMGAGAGTAGGGGGVCRHPAQIVSGSSVCEVVTGLVQRCMATSSCANVAFHSQVLCLVALIPRQDAHTLGLAFWRNLLQHVRVLLPLIHSASCAGSPATSASDATVGASGGGSAVGAGVGGGQNRLWMAQLQAALVLRAQTAAEQSAAAAGVGAGVGMGVHRGESVLEMAGSVAYLRRAALVALSVCVDVVGSEIRPHATEIIQVVRPHMPEEMAACMHVLRAIVSSLFASAPRHSARSHSAGNHRVPEGSVAGAAGGTGAGGGEAGAKSKGSWGRAPAPFVDNVFDLAKGVVGEALRFAKSSHDPSVLEAAAWVTEAVLRSSLHYQLWESVDRFLIFVTSQLKSEPLQLPRPRRLIARWLALLGHLPLSEYHPNAPVTLEQVAMLVSTFATRPCERSSPSATARVVTDHAFVGVQVMWRMVRHVVSKEQGDGGSAVVGGALQCLIFEELISCLGVDLASLEDASRDMAAAAGEGEGPCLGGFGVSRLMHEAQALWMLQAFVCGLRGFVDGESQADVPAQWGLQAQAMLDMICRAVLRLLVCRGCPSEALGHESQGRQGAWVLVMHGAACVLVSAGSDSVKDGAGLCPTNTGLPTYLCVTAAKALRQCLEGLQRVSDGSGGLEEQPSAEDAAGIVVGRGVEEGGGAAAVCIYRCYVVLSVYASWYLCRASAGVGRDGDGEEEGAGGGVIGDALREVIRLLVAIVDLQCRLVLAKEGCEDCGSAVKMLRLCLQTLLRMLCPDLGSDASWAHAEGENVAMPQDLTGMITYKHLQGLNVEARPEIVEIVRALVLPRAQVWCQVANSRFLPICCSVEMTHMLVLLTIDPLMLQIDAAPGAGAETSDRLCLSVPDDRAWEDVVKALSLVGGGCLVLSRRSAAVMTRAAPQQRMRAVDPRCAALLIKCPTLPVAAPLWAHINICQTCSAVLLRLLRREWQEEDDEHGRHKNSKVSIACASRHLTVLGQMAVSRGVVLAVWHRFLAPHARCKSVATPALLKLNALRDKLAKRQAAFAAKAPHQPPPTNHAQAPMDSPSTPFALLQASSGAAPVQPGRGGGGDGSGGSAGGVDVAIVAPLATLKGGGAGGRMRRGKVSEEETGASTRIVLRGESAEEGEGTKEENGDGREEEDQGEEVEDCRFAPPDYDECRDIWQLITSLLHASPTKAADKAEAGSETQNDFQFAMPLLSFSQDRLPSDMNPPPKREAARTKDDSGSPHAVECEGKLRSEPVVWEEEACIPEAMAVWLATQCGRGVEDVGTLCVAGLELEKGSEAGGDEDRTRGRGKALCVLSRLVAEGKLRVVNQALVQLMVLHAHVGAATSLLLTTFQDAMLHAPGTNFSKVFSTVLLYSKRTRPLTPQNFCQGMLSAPTTVETLEGPRCRCVNACARR